MDSTIAATLGNEDSRVGCRVSPAAGAAKAVSAAAEDGAGGLNQQAPEQNDIVTPCRAGPDVRVSGRGDPHPEGALHTVTLLGTLPHDELVSEEDNRGFGLIFAGVDQCGELVANGIGSIVGFGRKDQHRLFAVDLVPGRYTLQTPRQYEEQQNQQVLNFLLHRISRISRCKDTLFRAENTNPRQFFLKKSVFRLRNRGHERPSGVRIRNPEKYRHFCLFAPKRIFGNNSKTFIICECKYRMGNDRQGPLTSPITKTNLLVNRARHLSPQNMAIWLTSCLQSFNKKDKIIREQAGEIGQLRDRISVMGQNGWGYPYGKKQHQLYLPPQKKRLYY